METFAIFLDVDGVLNKESDWKRNGYVDQGCVNVLADIAKKIGKKYSVKLVLSSSWRTGVDVYGLKVSSDPLSTALSKAGLVISGKTPVSNKGRQAEIEYYARQKGIRHYITLDDDESLFADPKKANLYLVNYKTGLVRTDKKGILAMAKAFLP